MLDALNLSVIIRTKGQRWIVCSCQPLVSEGLLRIDRGSGRVFSCGRTF